MESSSRAIQPPLTSQVPNKKEAYKSGKASSTKEKAAKDTPLGEDFDVDQASEGDSASFSEKRQNVDAPSPTKSTPSAPLTSFRLFKKLPREIQLLIWSFAATRACILKLGWERNAQAPVHKATLREMPPMLHTCHDSRDIILQGMVDDKFPESSGLFKITDAQGTRAPERFHFSTKLDTLWIPSDFLYHGIFDRHFTLDVSTHVRHLATERHYIYDIHHTFPKLIKQHFPNLQTLTILITNPTMFLRSTGQGGDSPAQYQTFSSALGTETDGEINLDFSTANFHLRAIVEFEIISVQTIFQAMEMKDPSRKAPKLQFRDHRQFLEGQEVVNDDLVSQV